MQVYFRGSERIIFHFALMKKYVAENFGLKVDLVSLAFVSFSVDVNRCAWIPLIQ